MPEVVVVTGASPGVRRATARSFAERGAHIGPIVRDRDGLERARRDVESAGGKALVLQTDVAGAERVDPAAGAVDAITGSDTRRVGPPQKLLGGMPM